MARGEIDLVDLVAYPFYALGSLLALGVVTPVPTVAGIDLGMTLVSLGPQTQITLPNFVAVAALATMFGTNRPELDPWSFSYAWITIATALLTVGMPFIPLLENAASGSMLAAMVLFVFQSFGYGIASWMG